MTCVRNTIILFSRGHYCIDYCVYKKHNVLYVYGVGIQTSQPVRCLDTVLIPEFGKKIKPMWDSIILFLTSRNNNITCNFFSIALILPIFGYLFIFHLILNRAPKLKWYRRRDSVNISTHTTSPSISFFHSKILRFFKLMPSFKEFKIWNSILVEFLLDSNISILFAIRWIYSWKSVIS